MPGATLGVRCVALVEHLIDWFRVRYGIRRSAVRTLEETEERSPGHERHRREAERNVDVPAAASAERYINRE